MVYNGKSMKILLTWMIWGILEVHPFQETSIFRILKVDPFQHVHIQEAHRTDHIHTHFVVANFQSISKQFSKEGLIDTKISN